MNKPQETKPFHARRGYRWVSGAFGAFLAGVGAYVLVLSGPMTALSLGGGFALLLIGGNMVVSAYAGKESWLSRIGPLP